MAVAPPPVVDLRPLSTGELIDRGFTLYRNHFAGLFLLGLLSQGGRLILQVLTNVLHLLPTRDETALDLPHVLLKFAIYFAIAILMEMIRFCLAVVIITYISDIYLGHIPSVIDSFRRFSGKVPGTIWTWLLKNAFIMATLVFPLIVEFVMIVWVGRAPPHGFAGFAVVIGVGVILAAASLIPLLVVAMRLMLASPVLAIEGLAGWSACRRSSSLVGFDPKLGFFYWGETRLSLLLLPLFVIQLMIMALTSLPLIIAQTQELIRHGTASTMTNSSDWVIVGSQILTYLAGGLVLPLYSIAILLFYYDVRIRREGFDLELMASRLEITA